MRPTQTPSASATASPTQAPSASAAALPTATPVEALPAKWSEPVSVGKPGQCGSVAALIDPTGGHHIAAGCDGRIRYSVQVGSGWDTTELAPPDKREEHDPQLAFDRDVLYLAYTRIAVEEGGCGDPGLRDVGVYFRTATLPGGAWSKPRAIGEVADHIQSLRVVDGTIHATVKNENDDLIYYETLRGEAYHRYAIPRATGKVALRIGDDGKARVVYEADGALWYGVFTGSDLSAAKIPGTESGYQPVLVLGAGDRPHVLWSRGYHGAGCTYPDDRPEDGTYYSTKVGATWQSERLTPRQGLVSLTLDVGSDRVHALFNGPAGMVLASKSGTASWSTRTLTDSHPGDVVIRPDPRTDGLLVAYVAYEDEATRVYAMTYR